MNSPILRYEIQFCCRDAAILTPVVDQTCGLKILGGSGDFRATMIINVGWQFQIRQQPAKSVRVMFILTSTLHVASGSKLVLDVMLLTKSTFPLILVVQTNFDADQILRGAEILTRFTKIENMPLLTNFGIQQ